MSYRVRRASPAIQLFDAAMTFHLSGTSPTIRWFDGGASMLAQPTATLVR